MNKPIIQAENLIKQFGRGDSLFMALRGLDLEIFDREFVIVFGPSGSGKSTFLNIVSGLEEPTSGKITVYGHDLHTMTKNERVAYHRDKIGMVFQAYNLISSLTIMQNITLPLLFSKIPKKARIEKALRLLKSFELEKLAHRLPSEISGGQMQRIGIIRALINEPPIIIADEPTGNLDSESSKKVMQIFSDLNHDFNNTLLIVTHDSTLFHYADRVIFILDGKVVKQISNQKDKTRKVKEMSIFDKIIEKETDLKKRKIWNMLALILSNDQLAHLTEEELLRTSELIAERIEGKIDEHTLYFKLDEPFEQGGAGLYRQTARHIKQSIELIIKINRN